MNCLILINVFDEILSDYEIMIIFNYVFNDIFKKEEKLIKRNKLVFKRKRKLFEFFDFEAS